MPDIDQKEMANLNPEQPQPMGARFNPIEFYKQTIEKLPAAVAAALTVDGGRRSLVVKRAWVDPSVEKMIDIDDLAIAKRQKKSLTIPIYANVQLIDNGTGEVKSEVKKLRVGDFPAITPHGTFLLRGSEYSVMSQLRLRPGVYHHPKQNGELVASFNPAKGRPFELSYNKESGAITVGRQHSTAPLVPLLKALGASEEDLNKAWGNEFYAQNVKSYKNEDSEIKKLAKMFTGSEYPDVESSVVSLKKFFSETKMDPEIGKLLLNHPSENVDIKTLLESSNKLMRIYRGEDQPVDRDSLLYKSVHSMDDLIIDRLSHWKNKKELGNKIKSRIDRFDSVREIVHSADVTGVMNKFFMSGKDGGAGLVMLNDQINPVQMYSDLEKITAMGEGGISSERSIPLSARYLNPSSFGILDAVSTPESGRIGVVNHLAMGARKIGNRIGTVLVDKKTGEKITRPLIDFHSNIIALPDQFNTVRGKLVAKGDTIRAMKSGKMITVNPEEVDYIIPSPNSVFARTTMIAPMLGAISGARAQIGGKMIEQAVPLKFAEAPLVRSVNPNNKAYVENPALGFALMSREDGVVEKIEQDKMWIRTPDGRLVKHGMYDNYPMQSGSMLHHTPIVKPGDSVKKNQTLADSTFTRNGVLSLGTNLRVAYIPAMGFAHEDGVVISESAAKKLTSVHQYIKEFKTDQDSVAHKLKYRAAFPGALTDDHAKRLDDDGVIRVGEEIHPNDILIAGLKRREPRPEDAVLRRIGRQIAKPLTDSSVSWDGGTAGKVVRVEKLKSGVRVYITTEEPMAVGDKMVGAGTGNKGIVSKILPDDKMPRTADGDPIGVLFNPFGVPGRVNPAQILESALGKVAGKTGKPFYVSSFNDGDYVAMAKDHLSKNGIKDKEDLVDPETGRTIPNVFVGNSYWLKLKHKVSTKYSARDTAGYDIDGQPLRGGDEGAKRTDTLQNYAILSHGAYDVLKDISINKSNKNDELWRNIKLGIPLPPPKMTFATEKFFNLLRASGINPKKTGDEIALLPMTDKDTLDLSEGREIKNAFMVRADDLSEEKGGLFDPDTTGGMSGTKFSHIKLSEPLPNPVMEEAIMSLLGVTRAEIEGLISGKKGIGKGNKLQDYESGMLTGGNAIKSLLEKINPQQEFENVKTALAGETNITSINKLNKKGRVLRGLIQHKMNPADAYIINNIPVLPPIYRPAYPLGDGNLEVSSLNYLYRDMFLFNDRVNSFKDLAPEQVGDLRRDLYRSIKAVHGLGNPLTNRDLRGIITTIAGVGSPKYGYAQRKLIARPMDGVGRSTIIPDPHLHPDEVGLPHDMAWKIFQPYIIREMSKIGIKPLSAAEEIEKRSPRAKQALDTVMRERPVLLNRAPSLHKFSVMGFKAHSVDGDALQLPPLVFTGFNADTDGDSIIGDIIVEIDDMVSVIDISEFPVGDRILSSRKKDVYKVKSGVKSLSILNGVFPKFVQVDQFSVHKNLTMFDVGISGISQKIRASEDASLIVVNEANGLQMAIKPTESIGKFVPVAWKVDINEAPKSMPGEIFIGVATGAFMSSAVLGKEEDGTLYVPVTNASVGPSPALSISETEKLVTTLSNHTAQIVGVVSGSIIGRPYERFLKVKSGILMSMLMSFNKKTFFQNVNDLSIDFRTGAVFGILMSMSRRYSNRMHAMFHCNNEDMANALRFLAATIGLEIRFFGQNKKKILHGLRISGYRIGFGFIDPVCLESFKELSELYGIMKKELDSVERVSGVAFFKYWHPRLRKIARDGKYVPYDYECFEYLSKELNVNGTPEENRVFRNFSLRIKKNSIGDGHYRFIPIEIFHWIFQTIGPIMNERIYSNDFYKDMVSLFDSFVSYERIKSVETLPGKYTGYDLSVSSSGVFTHASGVSVKNTMMVSVPISDKAVSQSFDMFPSKHLLKPGTGGLMMTPKNEAAHGLYLMSKEGKNSGKRYDSYEAALKGLKNKEIEETDQIMVGKDFTTAGKIQINQALPEKYRNYKMTMDGPTMKKILASVAREQPKDYADTVFNLKALGDKAGYFYGVTIGLDDLVAPKAIRDPIFAQAKREYERLGKTDKALQDSYMGAREKIHAALDEHYSKNPSNLWDMMKSGALGKKDQAFQMMVAPVLVRDEMGQVVSSPITKSYSEGLNISDYFSTLYGQRSGMVDRALSTAEPGMIQKETIVATLGQSIAEEDCGDSLGTTIDIDDHSAYNRRLASDLLVDGQVVGRGGDVVTPGMIATAKKGGLSDLHVRSPMSCLSDHGLCQKCSGLNERGEDYPIGFNLGALSAMTIAEPLTQGVMKNFHQGGTVFSKNISGLKRIRQIIELPQIVANQGAVSMMDGLVEKIEKLPSGDQKVTVGGHPHFVQSGIDVSVHEGQNVKKGEMLSSGVAKPQEILEATGDVNAARKYIVDSLHKVYKEGNSLDMDKRFFEVIAKTISDHATVDDGGDSPYVLKGDKMPLTKVIRLNKELASKGMRPIEFRPELRGVVQTPLVSDDWLARMGARHLEKGLIAGVSFGEKTNVGPSGNYIPKFIYGIDLDKTPKIDTIKSVDDVGADVVKNEIENSTSFNVHGLGDENNAGQMKNLKDVKFEDMHFSGPAKIIKTKTTIKSDVPELK